MFLSAIVDVTINSANLESVLQGFEHYLEFVKIFKI